MDCDFERTLSNGRTGFAGFLGSIESYLESLDVPVDAIMTLMVVFDELVSNILDHGGATTVTVRLNVSVGTLAAELIDDGAAFDPLSCSEPETSLPVEDRPIGGLGLHIVRKLVDSMIYAREGNRNRLRFAKTYSVD
ncbi:ATP-binding protein [Sphingopyxis flava]|uniref:Anti-sigma regulatory factor (Ser/Thr protein kinase) n=1 Tax=Sphingopyxis flava TaxID=1507287 RepID=A0A1T5BIJ8_9SPHN|nr:ATP-binding protein [Sphingopyxis flava]SKB46975.1 Anti-sigma regulatory factor (Ser/Thr protein kinase) [Sphingopyxis flava]